MSTTPCVITRTARATERSTISARVIARSASPAVNALAASSAVPLSTTVSFTDDPFAAIRVAIADMRRGASPSREPATTVRIVGLEIYRYAYRLAPLATPTRLTTSRTFSQRGNRPDRIAAATARMPAPAATVWYCSRCICPITRPPKELGIATDACNASVAYVRGAQETFQGSPQRRHHFPYPTLNWINLDHCLFGGIQIQPPEAVSGARSRAHRDRNCWCDAIRKSLRSVAAKTIIQTDSNFAVTRDVKRSGSYVEILNLSAKV